MQFLTNSPTFNKYLSYSKGFLEGFICVYTNIYYFYKQIVVDMYQSLVGLSRGNTNKQAILNLFKNLLYLIYMVYTIYASIVNVKLVYNIGYINATIQSFKDNIYVYYFFGLIYLLAAAYVFVYKPVVKRINKYNLLRNYYPKLIQLLQDINIENCNKNMSETFTKVILDNSSIAGYLYSYNNDTHKFNFNRFRTDYDEIITDINGYEVLEANIEKLNLYDTKLEYLFFRSSSEGYKCFLFESNKFNFSNVYNINNYPKLYKKLKQHTSILNERLTILKQQTPICDDVINHIISKY